MSLKSYINVLSDTLQFRIQTHKSRVFTQSFGSAVGFEVNKCKPMAMEICSTKIVPSVQQGSTIVPLGVGKHQSDILVGYMSVYEM